MRSIFQLHALEQMEEKIYFKTSRFFWHLLAGIGGLALVCAILVYLWGVTPSQKPTVRKPVYPPPVAVTADEIIQRLVPPAKVSQAILPPSPAQPTAPEIVPLAQPQQTDSIALAYQAAIDTLQKLLPSSRFAWESQRRYQEPGWYNGRWHDGGWETVVVGISNKLENAYARANATDLAARTKLLQAYAKLVAQVGEPLRLQALESGMAISKNDVPTSVAGVNLLKAAVPHYAAYDVSYLDQLAEFSQRNPRDGFAFIEYANAIIPKFEARQREDALKTLIRSYYRNFDDITKQREATDLFLGMLASFPVENQVSALNEFYQLFMQKNQERTQVIQMMDQEYQSKLSEAEQVLADKQARKARLRSLAWKAASGSVVMIAFIALFLVLLSIQRNIRQLREATLPVKIGTESKAL